MAKMKKAQNGTVKLKEIEMKQMAKKDPKEAAKRPMGMNFDKKGFDSLPKLKTKKAEKGGKFGMLSVKAGIDNNPNPTQADRIAGAKKKAMSGMEMMKNGGKKLAKQAATAIAMKKAGKAPKKMMKNGGGILSAPKKDGLSMQLGTYKNVIGKNYTGKNVVNKGAKAKYGKSIMKMGGKCKNGC